MKRSIQFAVAILAILFLASNGEAYSQLGLHLGMQKARDADEASSMVGSSIRSRLENYGIEASIDYRREKFFDGEATVTTWPVMLTLLYFPIPFIHGDIGAGWFNTSIDYSTTLENQGAKDNASQKFGWHFGGGVEFPIQKVTLTAIVRYVFIDYDWNYVPGTSGRRGDFYMMTFGMLFGSNKSRYQII